MNPQNTTSNGSSNGIITQSATQNILLPVNEVKFTVQVNDKLNTFTKPSDEFIAKVNYDKFWLSKEFTLTQFASFIAAGGTWRPGIKVSGNKKSNITQAQLAAVDFDDDGAFLEFAELNHYAAIHHTTLSHSAEKPWKQRLIFILDRTVSSIELELINKILLFQYPAADASCKDAGRFFFGSNQPCLSVNNVTLDVEWLFNTFPLSKEAKRNTKKVINKRPTKSADIGTEEEGFEDFESTGKGKKKKTLTPCELIYRDIYLGQCDGEIEQLYCLFDHNFKDREPEEGLIKTVVGSNPFSPTNSSGTSFTVSEKDGLLPFWYDKSQNAEPNRYTGKEGGSFLQYWFQLSPEFQKSNKNGTERKFSEVPVLLDVYKYFDVRVPAQYKLESLKDKMRRDLQFKLRFNEMGSRIEYGGEEIQEGLQSWLSRELGLHGYTQDVIKQCLYAVARENTYHPFIEKVNGLEVAPNYALFNNLISIFGESNYSETERELFNEYLRKFFCGIWARVNFPGCKLDTVLILQGLQGLGKSSFFKEAVFGDKFFSESLTLNDFGKDSVMIEQRKVLHELAEVVSHFQRDAASIRNIITQSETEVRLPYAADAITLKRRSAFCGTANEEAILNDAYGNRRYWIIPVKQLVDFDIFTTQVASIWATVKAEMEHINTIEEASKFIRLPQKYWSLSAQNSAQFEKYDALTELVQTIVKDKFNGRDFQMTELLTFLYPDKSSTTSKAEQSRVGSCLETLGYSKKQKRVNGVRGNFWAKTRLTDSDPLEVSEATAKPSTEESPQETIEQPLEVKPEPTQLALPPAETQEVIFSEQHQELLPVVTADDFLSDEPQNNVTLTQEVTVTTSTQQDKTNKPTPKPKLNKSNHTQQDEEEETEIEITVIVPRSGKKKPNFS